MNEFLLILIIGLVVIGPKRLPMVLRTMGQWMAQFKRATNELRDAVSTEVHSYSEFRDLQEFKDSVEQEVNEFRSQTASHVAKELAPEREVFQETAGALRQLEGDPALLADPEAAPPPAGDTEPRAGMATAGPQPAGVGEAELSGVAAPEPAPEDPSPENAAPEPGRPAGSGDSA